MLIYIKTIEHQNVDADVELDHLVKMVQQIISSFSVKFHVILFIILLNAIHEIMPACLREYNDPYEYD